MLKLNMFSDKIILAIETSCDETAAAVVKGNKILGQEVYSQLEKHQSYGGVVPTIAKLEHELKIDNVINAALNRAQMPLKSVEAIAVTIGPGLAIALEVGVRKAKELATLLNVPLIAVNHMFGHLVSGYVSRETSDAAFPALGILISGGHSEFLLVENLNNIKKIGETLDDACGEAFDKFARMVGLAYPGGPKVAAIASSVRDNFTFSVKKESSGTKLEALNNYSGRKLALPIPLANNPEFNLSYSGLKTAVKNLIAQELGISNKQNIQNISDISNTSTLNEDFIQHLCVLFETTAFEHIKITIQKILKHNPKIKTLIVGGGVVANTYFRELLEDFCRDSSIDLIISPKELSTDNAAMIGIAASTQLYNAEKSINNATDSQVYYDLQDITSLDRNPSLSFN